jgi:hypothetical protein
LTEISVVPSEGRLLFLIFRPENARAPHGALLVFMTRWACRSVRRAARREADSRSARSGGPLTAQNAGDRRTACTAILRRARWDARRITPALMEPRLAVAVVGPLNLFQCLVSLDGGFHH